MPEAISDQLVQKVSDYLRTDAAKNSFTAGEIDGLVGAVGDDLQNVIRKFVDVMGPKSKNTLNQGDIKEFSKSIARSLISQTKDRDGSFVFDENKANAALNNFKNLDKSKYDKDGKYIQEDILNVLNDRKHDLRYHKEFEPRMNITAFSTQALPEEISGNKVLEDKTVSLTAGIVAKLAGMSSPLVKNKGVNSGILSAAHDASMDFIKNNINALEQLDRDALMQIGKQVGKEVRDLLAQPSSDAKAVIRGALTRVYNNNRTPGR